MSESRALIAAVIAPGWQMPDIDTIVVPQVEQAIAEIEQARPLIELEPHGVVRSDREKLGYAFPGLASKRLCDGLRPIGIKIAPTMEPLQVGAWIAAMILALGDLPPKVAVGAVEKAIHKPMRFLNEVETIVRECAEDIQTARRLAVLRLRAMQREIERAKMTQPRLEAPKREPWTQERVDEANALFASQGLRTRYRLDPAEPEGVASYQVKHENRATDIDAADSQA